MIAVAKKIASHVFYGSQQALAKFLYQLAPLTSPSFLSDESFDGFVARHREIPVSPSQDYTDQGMIRRGIERAAALNAVAPVRGLNVLEVGPADGCVLGALLKLGARQALGVDVADQMLPAVKEAGVKLVLNSSERMTSIPDRSVDLVFSYGSFEHVPEPEATFDECFRILKPGGVFFMEAGPLYYSPWGYHFYAILHAPYIHLLYRKNLLEAYAKKQGKTVPWTNLRPASAYLEAIAKQETHATLLSLKKGYDWFHSGVILRHPKIFKSKGLDFNDFFVDTIKVVMKKNEI